MNTASAGGKERLAAVVASSMLGTAIEFYDFFIYATAAALVFPHLFFPTLRPVYGLMASYATLAIPFTTRPIGALLFGHYGDRFGRKKMLIVALLVMGLSTFGMGLMPGFAAIGGWAPVLVILLRLLQGLGLGGEWGGAAAMVIECAPRGRRGFYGSFVQTGTMIGLFLSVLVFALIPQASLLAGGWRIPFLASIAALALGLFMRARLAETPLFSALVARKAVRRAPVADILRWGKRAVLLAMGVRTAEMVLGWLVVGFLLSYATRTLGFSAREVLWAILAASAAAMATGPLAGWVSDRVGRRPVLLFGACASALVAFPLFWLADTGSFPLFLFAVAFAFAVGDAVMFAVQPAFFAEAFATGVRYTGISLGFQLAGITGGLTPLLATWLLTLSGGRSWIISLFLLAACAVTIACALAMPERARARLELGEVERQQGVAD